MEIQLAPMAFAELTPSFDTPRLQLRPLAECDEALYCRLYTDPGVMRHIAAPLTPEAAQRAFHKVIQLMRQPVPSVRLWVLTEHAASLDLGIAALLRDAQMPDALETGTMLLAAGRGRGIAVEAQVALLDWLFDGTEVRRVWSRNASANGAESGVRLKLGFARAAAGAPGNQQIRWQMTGEQWRARRGVDLA